MCTAVSGVFFLWFQPENYSSLGVALIFYICLCLHPSKTGEKMVCCDLYH